MFAISSGGRSGRFVGGIFLLWGGLMMLLFFWEG